MMAKLKRAQMSDKLAPRQKAMKRVNKLPQLSESVM